MYFYAFFFDTFTLQAEFHDYWCFVRPFFLSLSLLVSCFSCVILFLIDRGPSTVRIAKVKGHATAYGSGWPGACCW